MSRERADPDPPAAAAAMAPGSSIERTVDGPSDASPVSSAHPSTSRRYGSTHSASPPSASQLAPRSSPPATDVDADEADTRPAWRQPSPLWILPFTFMLTLSLGMTLPPRPQLLINLACVAHPPVAREGGAFGGGMGVESGVGLVVTDNVWMQPDQLGATDATHWPSQLHAVQWSASSMPIPVPLPPSSPNTTDPIRDINPARCRRDVEVQKLTARVQMGLRLLGGLLAVLTTGFWASLSDSWGPSRVMALSMLGILINDASFLLVASAPRLVIRPGLWILFVGPMLDGMLGSLPALSAVLSAYVASTAGKGGLVKYFAMVNGLLSCGGAVSPIFGSWLIRVSGDLIALVSHALLILFLLFVLPDPIRPRNKSTDESGEMTILARLWAPFAALTMFVPTQGRTGWNMFIMAALTCILGQTGGMADPKTQYAVYVFDWEPTALGAFLTLSMVARVIVLMIFVPLLNRFVKPYFIHSPVATGPTEGATERTPLLAPPPPPRPEPHLTPTDLSEPSDPASLIDFPDPAAPPPPPPTTESLHFDHALLLACLAIETIAAFGLGGNARGSQVLFVAFSVFGHLGSPSAAGAGSLAVALGPEGMPPGRLFGALGVLEALTAGSVWPVLYTAVWVGSIGWYPPAMFLLAGLVWFGAAVMTAMIRLPRGGEVG